MEGFRVLEDSDYVPVFDEEQPAETPAPAEPVAAQPTAPLSTPEPAATTPQTTPAAAAPTGKFYVIEDSDYKPVFEKGTYTGQAFLGTARGAVGGTAGAIKGVAGASEQVMQEQPEIARRRLELFDIIDQGGDVGELAPAEVRSVQQYQQMTPEARLQARAEYAAPAAVKPGDIRDNPIFKVADFVQDWSDEQFKAAHDFENGLWAKTFEGLGSLVPTMAASLTMGPAGGIAVGMGMSGGEAIDRALQAGVSPEQMMEVLKYGMLPGATEQIPLEVLFSKFPAGQWGRLANILYKGVSTAVAEGGQEMAQTFLQNVIAKYNYKEGQDLTEGIWEAGGIGAIVGGVVGVPVGTIEKLEATPAKPQTGETDATGDADPAATAAAIAESEAAKAAGSGTPGNLGGSNVPTPPVGAPAQKTEEASKGPPGGPPAPADTSKTATVTIVQPGEPDPAAALTLQPESAAGAPPTAPVVGAAPPPLNVGAQPSTEEEVETEEVAPETAIPVPGAADVDPEEAARLAKVAEARKRAINQITETRIRESGGTDVDVAEALRALNEPTPQTAVTAAVPQVPAPEPAGTPEAAVRRAAPQDLAPSPTQAPIETSEQRAQRQDVEALARGVTTPAAVAKRAGRRKAVPGTPAWMTEGFTEEPAAPVEPAPVLQAAEFATREPAAAAPAPVVTEGQPIPRTPPAERPAGRITLRGTFEGLGEAMGIRPAEAGTVTAERRTEEGQPETVAVRLQKLKRRGKVKPKPIERFGVVTKQASQAPKKLKRMVAKMLATNAMKALDLDVVSESPEFAEVTDLIASEHLEHQEGSIAPNRLVAELEGASIETVRKYFKGKGRHEETTAEKQEAKAKVLAEGRQRVHAETGEKPAVAIYLEDEDTIRDRIAKEKEKPEGERDPDIMELEDLLKQRKKLKGGGKERKLTEEEREEGQTTRKEKRAAVTEQIRQVQERRAVAQAEREKTAREAKAKAVAEAEEAATPTKPRYEMSEEERKASDRAQARARKGKVGPIVKAAIDSVPSPNWDVMTPGAFKQAALQHMKDIVAAVRTALDKVNESLRSDTSVKLNSPEENLAILARNEVAKSERGKRPNLEKFVHGLLLLQAGDVQGFHDLFRSEQEAGTTGEAEERAVLGRSVGEARRKQPRFYDKPKSQVPVAPKPLIGPSGVEDRSFWSAPDERTTMETLDRDGNPITIEVHSRHKGSTLLTAFGKDSRIWPLHVNVRGGFVDLINRMHAKALKALVGDIDVFFIGEEDMIKLRHKDVAGTYIGVKSRPLAEGQHKPAIYINADHFLGLGRERRSHVVLHEMTHAATAMAIKENINGVGTLMEDMRERLEKQIRASGQWDLLNEDQKYGFINVDEFVTQAFSEPSFQELLAIAEVPMRFRERVAEIVDQAERPKWWTWFVNAVSRAIGMDKVFAGRGRTYMEQIVAVYPELVQSSEEQVRYARELIARKDADKSLLAKSMSELKARISRKFGPPEDPFDLPKLIDSATDAVEGQLRSKSGVFSRSSRYLQNKWTTTSNHIRNSDARFGGPGNVFAKWAIEGLKSSVKMRKAARKGAAIVERMADMQRNHGDDFSKGKNILYDATVGGYNPMVGLKDPSNAHIKGGELDAHTRADHARTHAEWAKLDAGVRSSLHDWVEHLRALEQEGVSEQIKYAVDNALKKNGIKLPTGEDSASIQKWIMDGGVNKKAPADPKNIQPNERTARDDALHKALGKNAKSLAELAGMHHIKGVYVPLMRDGSLFFSATHDVPVPKGAAIDPLAKDGNVLIFDNVQDYRDFVKNAGKNDRTQIQGKPRIEHLDPATGVNVGKKDVRGRPYYIVTIQNKSMEMADNEADLEHLRQEYEKNGFKTSPVGHVDSDLHRNTAILPEQVQSLIRSIEHNAPSQSAAKAAVGSLIDAYVRSIAGNKAAHRRIRRKGVKGFSRDLVQDSFNVNRTLSARVANIGITHQLADLENAVQDYIDQGHKRAYPSNKYDQLQRQEMFAEVKKRFLSVRNQGPSLLHEPIKVILDWSFIYRLMTPAYSAANILGGISTFTAVLLGKDSLFKVGRAMTWGMKELGAVDVTLKGLSQTVREARNLYGGGSKGFSFYEDFLMPRLPAGSLLRRFADELEARDLGVGAGLETSAVSEIGLSAGDRITNRTLKLARAFPEAAETLNRYIGGFAAIKLAKDRGLTDEQAIEYAVNAVERSQGGYGAENNPAVFNHPVGKIAFQFRKYPVMYGQLYFGALKGALGLSDQLSRKEGARTFAYLTAWNVVLAGVFGQPVMEFAKVFATIVGGLMGGDDWEDWENWMQGMIHDVLGDTWGEMVSHGFSRGFGIDLSNRLGNENIFTFGSPKKLESDQMISWVAQMAAGAPGGMAIDAFKSFRKAVDEGSVVEALKSAPPWPKFIDDSIKALDAYQSGPTTRAGREYAPSLTGPEAVAKSLGFRPAAEARRFEYKGTTSEHFKEEGRKNERSKVMGKWTSASPAERQSVWREDVRQWNADNPDMKIDYQSLQRSLQRRKQEEREEKRKQKRG